jgi:hypothetical protein
MRRLKPERERGMSEEEWSNRYSHTDHWLKVPGNAALCSSVKSDTAKDWTASWMIDSAASKRWTASTAERK